MPNTQTIRETQAAQDWACRGPYLLPAERRHALDVKYQAVRNDPAAAGAFLVELHAILYPREGVLDVPTGEAIHRAAARLIGARRGCGVALKDKVLALSLDGGVHQVTCDACGNVVEFTTPLADENVADVTATRDAALDTLLG